MKARLLFNLVLALLVIVLAVILSLAKDIPTPPQTVTLTSTDPDSIQSIRISRKDKVDVEITKLEDHWQIITPVQARASVFRVSSILAFLRSPVISQIQVNTDELTKFGLLRPEVVLYLDELVFFFGDINPLDQSRYLLYRDRIYLIEDVLYHQLLQDTGFFISTRLFEDTQGLSRIRCAGGENPLSGLSKEQVENWAHLQASRVSTITVTSKPMGKLLVETVAGTSLSIAVAGLGQELILTPQDTELHYWIPRRIAPDLGIPATGCAD